MSWCGGVWGNRDYPKEDPTYAPYVLLTEEEGGGLTASITAATRDGVPNAVGLPSAFNNKVWTVYAPGVTSSSIMEDAIITVHSPFEDEKFDLCDRAITALHRLTRNLRMRMDYNGTNRPVDFDRPRTTYPTGLVASVSVMPEEFSLTIVVADNERYVANFTSAELVMGGLRAAYAYELSWRSPESFTNPP